MSSFKPNYRKRQKSQYIMYIAFTTTRLGRRNNDHFQTCSQDFSSRQIRSTHDAIKVLRPEVKSRLIK